MNALINTAPNPLVGALRAGPACSQKISITTSFAHRW